MNFPKTLCRAYIGGPAALWEQAETVWQAYANVGEYQQKWRVLEQLLAVQRDPAAGAAQLATLCGLCAPADKGLLAVAALGAVLPAALAQQRQRGIPDAVLRATYPDLLRWVGDYAHRHGGAYGVEELGWVVHPYTATLFQLGSLQYQPWANPFPLYAYARGGELALFMAGGVALDAGGYLCGTNGRHGKQAVVTAFRQDATTVYGHRIHTETATASLTPAHWPCAGAVQLLQPRQKIILVHIPAGADLSDAAITESRRQAEEFFAAAGPNPLVFLCDSWLLDVTLQKLLPPTSKVLRFASRFVRFPVAAEAATGVRYVFRSDFTPAILPDFPAETGLQKAMKQHLLSGGELFDTGGIMLPVGREG